MLYEVITIKEKIEYKGMKNVEVKFPLIEDIKMEVAKKFGMIQPGASDTQAVRAVFIIDPKSIVRCILYYPSSTGRNFDEIKRIIIALQTADEQGVATPANWQPRITSYNVCYTKLLRSRGIIKSSGACPASFSHPFFKASR